MTVEKLTQAEMDGLQFHPEWEDGRGVYLWYRFDAVVDRDRMLRAELTWNDDFEQVEDELNVVYLDPILLLERNVFGDDDPRRWQTLCSLELEVSQARAREILLAPPTQLLVDYATEFEKLLETRP